MIDEATAIAEFLRTRGATRCPTAFAARSAAATLGREDVDQLRQHHARQEGAGAVTGAAVDAARVHQALAERGWTQRQLALRIGVSSSQLSAALRWGKRLDPRAAERLRAWLDQPPCSA